MPAIEQSTRERARRAGFERWLVTPVVPSELEDLLLQHQTLEDLRPARDDAVVEAKRARGPSMARADAANLSRGLQFT